MGSVSLALIFSCWFIYLQGGPISRTGVAPASTLVATTCEAHAIQSETWTFDNWGSQTVSQGCGATLQSPLLELGRAKLSNSTSCRHDGLALQEMPDPAVRFQRTLLEMRCALEQGLATDTDTTEKWQQIAEQAEDGTQKGRGRRRSTCLRGQDSLGKLYTQFEAQCGGSDYNSSTTNRGHQCGGEHIGFATGTQSPRTSRPRRFSQDVGASERPQAGADLFTSGVGTKTAGVGGQAQCSGSAAESWAFEPYGEDAEADYSSVREDRQARPGLAYVHLPGRREISQAQSVIPRDPRRTREVTQSQGDGARADQNGDLQGIPVASQHIQCKSQRCDRVGRLGAYAFPATSRSTVGRDGGVPHSRRRRGDGCSGGSRWEAGSACLPKACGGRISEAGGQGPLEAQGNQNQGDQVSDDIWEDELGQLLSIPVDCVIDDVFEGSWGWLSDECELHYTKDNLDLRSGACSFHLDDRCSPGEVLQHAQVGNRSMDHLVPGDGPLDVQSGEHDVELQQARTVRFNPHVEVVEFVAHVHIDLFQVDDVISCPDGSGECCPQDHFEEEVVDMFPVVQSLDTEEAPQDMDDAEDDPYVILHGFEVLETSTLGSSASDLEPMQVITFGIRGQALGRRDTWVTVAELPALRRAVWELWQDEVPQFSACWAFAVRPQPLKELGVAKAWVLLVEIDPGQATPPGHCAVLMMTCSNANWMVGRPTPKLVLEDTSSDALVPQHFWASYCRPLGIRYCSLILEGDVKSPFEPVHVRPGALSKLMLGDAPSAFE